MKLIHITDIHLVPEGQTLHGINPLRRLELAVDSINDEYADADMVVFTGDLTDRGDEKSYQDFRKHADRLTMPYYVILGNHDNRKSFSQCFPEVPLDENGFVQYVVKNDTGTFIMCDTLSNMSRNGIHENHGNYCKKRCAWLQEQLEQASGDVYIFMHHPLVDCGIDMLDAIKLLDDEAVYEVFKPHQHKIRHMFFGHTHFCTSGQWHGIPYNVMRATGLQVQLALGTLDPNRPSNNLESPAYGVVLLNNENTIYHSYSFADTAPKLYINWNEVAQLTSEQWEIKCKTNIAAYKNWSDY